MLILAILGLGMGVGALAQLIVGKEGPRVDWTMAFVAGFAGSLVGGLLFSLIAGDGLAIRLSGILGSLIGAIIITAVWQWYSRRKKAEARAAERSARPFGPPPPRADPAADSLSMVRTRQADARHDAPGSSAPTIICTPRSRAGCRRRRARPTEFLEILELVWWRLDRALDLEMIEWSAKLGALEALESGCTAIIDHHESPNAIEGSLSVIADACAEVGVRVSTCYGVTDRHGADGAASRPRGERPVPRAPAGAAWSASTPRSRAATTRSPRPPNSPGDHGVGVHIHVAEGPADAGAAERLRRAVRRRLARSCTGCTCPTTTACAARSCTTRAPT